MKTKELQILFEEWITKLAKTGEKSPSTIKTYTNALTNLFDFLSTEGIETIDKEALLKYKSQLVEQKEQGKIKTSTVNTRITILNKFLSDNDLDSLKIKREKSTVKTSNNDTLTETDYKRLIRWADNLGMEREKLLMQTLANTGIRIDELKYFTVDALKSLKGSNCSITVKNKGKERSISVPDKIKKDLLKYAKKNGLTGDDVIFHSSRDKKKLLDKSQIWRNLQKIAGRARVKKAKVHAHSYRHLFAQRFLSLRPDDISTLADLMGHSSIETTRLYTRLSNRSQKDIANSLQKLFEETFE